MGSTPSLFAFILPAMHRFVYEGTVNFARFFAKALTFPGEFCRIQKTAYKALSRVVEETGPVKPSNLALVKVLNPAVISER